jgi:2-oxoisovalerate dehydrogenase E1 component alpha subunit
VLVKGVDRARAGGGPVLVEAFTYRMQSHTNADDATRYRTDEEVQAWLPRDPITRMRSYLTGLHLLTGQLEEEFSREAETVAARMRDGLNAEVQVDPEDLFRFVYTEKTAQLREQAAKLRDELDRESL